MKKSVLLITMGVLFFFGLTAMVSADPPGNTTCKVQCEFLVSEGVFSSQGVCMSACNTCTNKSSNPVTQQVCYCRQVGDMEGFPNNTMKNMGECVRYFKAILGGS